MPHTRQIIAFSIGLIAAPLYNIQAQTVDFHTTSDKENDVVVVPNRDMNISIGHDLGDMRIEITSNDQYRTYRATLDQSSYVAYANLEADQKHFVFDLTQRRFRALTSSVIVELHDDRTLEHVMADHDVAWGRGYPTLGFAALRLSQGANPTSVVEQLRLDPRVVDAQVTFADQFRRYTGTLSPTNRTSSADHQPLGKESLTEDLYIVPKLEFTAPDPTFNIDIFNFGGTTSRISTLRSELVSVVPNPTTSDPNGLTFSTVATDHKRIEPIDPKGEPFEITVTFERDSLDANTTYLLVLNVFAGAFPAIGTARQATGQSGFTFDALKRIRFTCTAPDQELMSAGTDPLLTHQWHLTNTGQSALARRGGTAGEDLGMAETLSTGPTGSGVKVAVVDTGLELCHPDLWANVEQGASFNFNAESLETTELDPWLFRQESSDPFNFDPAVGHGTSVAGLIAATADNSVGGRGVAPNAHLRGYNMLQASDQLHALIASLGASDFQPDSTDVDIFNMSFGKFSQPPTKLAAYEEQVLLNGVRKLRSGNGVIYVKAAGNSFIDCHSLSRDINNQIGCVSTNVDAAQSLPYMIMVGAHNAAGTKSSYSSAGANIWVSAPGGEFGVNFPALVSTDSMGLDRGLGTLVRALGRSLSLERDDELNPHGNYLSIMNGTSAAAPNASGAVALLLEENPSFTWRDVKHVLANSARKIDPDIEAVDLTIDASSKTVRLPWTENAAGYSYHNWYGFGAVAIDDALEFAEEHEPNSLGDFRESGWFELSETVDIPDNDLAGVSQSLNVRGLIADADIEAVVVEIDWEHEFPNDLGVHLISPEGTRSVIQQVFNEALAVQDMGTFTWRVLSNAFYGENPNGDWRLEVFDADAEDVGQVFSWRLRVYYGEHP
ncbi:MAG: S8 family serine peptidase [Gammaproteobacteria bacterium]|nr:S8 family serine peptidase [Gammaproteobacteria bacterium]